MNYDMPFPNNTVLRINLAWINNLQEFQNILDKHKEYSFFVDLPIKRVKPPNNKYAIEDLVPILENYPNIKYFAISNVESFEDIESYLKIIPTNITIVPKIESPDGITNIKNILKDLPYNKKIIMLDHDDLFSNLTKRNEPASNFNDWVTKLVNYCNEDNILLLRTRGVIFSDTL